MDLPFQLAVVPVTPFQQNCTLIWDPASLRAVVVDPGGDVARIMAAITELKLKPELILLTHGHLDHAGGADELRALLTERNAGTLVPVHGPHEADDFLLKKLKHQGEVNGIMDMRDLVTDRWLQEGDQMTLLGHRFTVRHCPGHTPGHLVYIADTLPFALVGDVLFRGAVGRTDFPGYGNHDQLMASIRDKLLPLDDDVAFIPGHGPASTIGAERRSNPFLQ